MNQCLLMTTLEEQYSLAIPALGTGQLKYPGTEVAKIMIDAVIEHLEKNPTGSISDVKIVIFNKDQKTQQVRPLPCFM